MPRNNVYFRTVYFRTDWTDSVKNAGKSFFIESVIEDTGASIPMLSNEQKLCTSLFGSSFPAVGEEEMQHKTEGVTFEIFESSLLFEQMPETI